MLPSRSIKYVGSGSKGEILTASRCFLLFSQQRTFGSAFADLLGATRGRRSLALFKGRAVSLSHVPNQINELKGDSQGNVLPSWREPAPQIVRMHPKVRRSFCQNGLLKTRRRDRRA